MGLFHGLFEACPVGKDSFCLPTGICLNNLSDTLHDMKAGIKNYLQQNKWPLVVALAAVAIRVIYLLQLSRLPESMVPLVDERWHWEWAHEIIEQSFWGREAYFRAPLYPYFLALLAWVTSGSVLASKMLQVVLTGGTAWILYRLSEHLFNRTTAVVAGLAYAFYGTLVFYETMFLIPVLFLFLTVWGMYRVIVYRESVSWRTWLLTGVIFGLAAISRPNILLIVPFLLLWMFVTASPDGGWLKRMRIPAITAAGVILMIAPVTLRNALVTGDFILISSQGGINLYLGNNPEADGLTMLMPEVDLDESVDWREFRRVTEFAAEQEAFRELSEAEQSSFWMKKALRFMSENPGQFLSLVWTKTIYLVSGYENSDNADLYHQRTKSSLYSVLLWNKVIYFPFGLLLPLALVGLCVCRKQARRLWPVYIFLLAYIPTIVLFLVTARHRLPLVPFLIMLAAGGVVTLWQSRREIGRGELAVVAIVFLGGLGVFNRTYLDKGYFNPFQTYFNDGIRYAALGDLERAEQAFLMAERAYPYSPSLLGNLAHVQLQLGKYVPANLNLHRAISLKPEFADPYNDLGILVNKTGNTDSAIVLFRMAVDRHDRSSDSPEKLAHFCMNLADAFETKVWPDSVERYLLMARQAAPEFPRGYFRSAAYYARQSRYAASDSLYHLGSLYGSPSTADLFNWGLSYLRRQEYSTATEKMFAVIERDSTFYQAYHCIAASYFENGLPADSVERYLRFALHYNPSYAPALRLQETVSGRK